MVFFKTSILAGSANSASKNPNLNHGKRYMQPNVFNSKFCVHVGVIETFFYYWCYWSFFDGIVLIQSIWEIWAIQRFRVSILQIGGTDTPKEILSL